MYHLILLILSLHSRKLNAHCGKRAAYVGDLQSFLLVPWGLDNFLPFTLQEESVSVVMKKQTTNDL